MFLKKILSSKFIILICIASVNYSHKDWKNPNKVIHQDINCYYLYLPATFIYHDLTLKYADNAPEEVKSKAWYNLSPIQERVSKMSCGLAMMICPFFLVSHAYAICSDYPANGNSLPYRFGIVVAAIVFLGIGLYYLRKTLNLFFPEFITMICSFL